MKHSEPSEAIGGTRGDGLGGAGPHLNLAGPRKVIFEILSE